MNSLILYKCETPLHAGSGTELGVVDMPIQREIHTGFPKVEASGIKGAFRNDFYNQNSDGNKESNITNIFFGPENDGSEYASSLEFTDARILLFPVKSARGIFAWVTCPFVINRFIKDLGIKGIKEISEDNVKGIEPLEDTAITLNKNNQTNKDYKSNVILNDDKSNEDKYILLEEFGYKVYSHKNIFENLLEKMKFPDEENENYIIDKLSKDIVVVNDEAFSYFVNMSTEVNTRIRIGEDGVVKDGALFTEEYVPEETIMYNFISIDEKMVNKNAKKVLEKLEKPLVDKKAKQVIEDYFKGLKYIQLGGNTTLGKGIVKVFHMLGNDKK